MAHNIFRNEYMQIPVVTRFYVTACTLTTLAVQMNVVSNLELLYHPHLILKGEVWRLVTCFLFFGYLGFNFLFNMVFLYRFSRKLEEGCFAGNPAGFIVMLLFGAVLSLLVSTFMIRMLFLGECLATMIVYVWSRRNPGVMYNFFGLFTFQAPYLPWLLLLLSFLFGGSVLSDLVGIGIGHAYYFLEDVFPSKPGGFKILRTPQFMKTLFNGPQADPNYNVLPEDRPGGFNWGEGRPVGQ
ncbi:hypothetical protein EMCRGX_G023925 [Ephydatia muelleri]|eukprot:Em0015g154a